MLRVFVLVFCLVPAGAWAQSIMKCQDADGKWHYGDYAAEECARSRVTEIDPSGVELQQIKPPPTKEELEAEARMEKNMAKEEKLESQQKELDQRLLNTYESEANIIRSRDSLLAAIDESIKADQILKQRLEDDLAKLKQNSTQKDFKQKAAALTQQIKEFEASIRDRLASRELARARYDSELSRYRELVNAKQ